jgi:nucleoside-diphosphate-sugar epimerase
MILITGITGFIGTNLAKRLIEKDYAIIGLTKSKRELQIKNISIPVFNTENDNVEKIFQENEVDTVIHLATEYVRDNNYSNQIYDTNFKLPCQLTELAIKYNCKLFINCESFFQKDEQSGYSHGYVDSKNLFREFLSKRSREIKAVSLQLEHVFGQNDNPSKLIPHIINTALNGENKLNLGFCRVLRDPIYINDVIDAFLIIMETNEDLLQKKYEVGLGESIYLTEVIKRLLEIIINKYPKSKLNYEKIEFSSDLNNQMLSSKADIKALMNIGWKPKHSIEEGLNATVDYYINKLED